MKSYKVELTTNETLIMSSKIETNPIIVSRIHIEALTKYFEANKNYHSADLAAAAQHVLHLANNSVEISLLLKEATEGPVPTPTPLSNTKPPLPTLQWKSGGVESVKAGYWGGVIEHVFLENGNTCVRLSRIYGTSLATIYETHQLPPTTDYSWLYCEANSTPGEVKYLVMENESVFCVCNEEVVKKLFRMLPTHVHQ